MDAFSLAISLSALNISSSKTFRYSAFVGIFHFIMPILGYLLKEIFVRFYDINTNKIFVGVIIFIIIGIILDNDKKLAKKVINPFVFAFMVSIDSFSLGLSLNKSTLLIASLIFSFLSFSFTFIGFNIGKYIKNNLEKYSKIISISILLLVLVLKLQ